MDSSHSIWTTPNLPKLNNRPPASPFMMIKDPAQQPLTATAARQGLTPCTLIAIPTIRRLRNGLIRIHQGLPEDASPTRGKHQTWWYARGTKWKSSRPPSSTHLAPGCLYLCDPSGWGPSLAKRQEAHKESQVMFVRDNSKNVGYTSSYSNQPFPQFSPHAD